MHTSNGVCEISVLYTQKHQHIWFLSCTQSTAQMHSAEKLSINPANTWAPRFSAVTQLTVLLVQSFNWLYTTEHTMLLQNYKWIQDFFKPKSPQICFYKELPNKLMKGQNDSHELNCPRPNTHHRAHAFCVRFQEGYKPQNCQYEPVAWTRSTSVITLALKPLTLCGRCFLFLCLLNVL